jgi:hypothetical protein
MIREFTREHIVKHVGNSELKDGRALSHRAIFPPKMNAGCCGTAQKGCATQVHDARMLDDRCDCCECDIDAERWDGMS